jgi:hypothetical protein
MSGSHWWGYSIITRPTIPDLDFRKEGDMTRYEELDTKLHDRRFKPPKSLDRRKVANNTWLTRNGENITVILYSTPILEFRPNGTVSLNAAGWKTVTTKTRMNSLIGPHLSVHGSGGGSWAVTARQTDTHQAVHWHEEIAWTHTVTYPFYNGMSFDVETGLLVWNPHEWEPLEYMDGMLSGPIINRLTTLEDHITERLEGREAITNDFLQECLVRHESIVTAYSKLRKKLESEVSRVEWRMETTLAAAMQGFKAAAAQRQVTATDTEEVEPSDV